MLKVSAVVAGALLALLISGCISSASDRPEAVVERSATSAEFPVMHTAPEKVPRTVAHALKQTLPGLSRLPAQEVPTSLHVLQVWALANAQRVCLISLEKRSGGLGLTCQPVAIAMKDGIAITLIGRFDRAAAQRAIIGIVPQGVNAAVATVYGGSSVTMSVANGTFARVDSELMPPDRLSVHQGIDQQG